MKLTVFSKNIFSYEITVDSTKERLSLRQKNNLNSTALDISVH